MSRTVSSKLLRDIADNDAVAEIRISWVQLTLVLFFGLLYSLAPRAEGASEFNIVPYSLAIYTGFILVRLVLAHKRKLTRPFLILSVFVDVGLITGLIYSFHIQYGQPAAFYLKVPTILYFFLFIALRALRFDAFYVILTGMTAATAWGMLAAYAVFLEEDAMGITRNYVDHLSGNMVLVGAEIDKMMVIVAVTTVLAYALVRARTLLFNAVADSAAVGNLSRFFTDDVAKIVGSEDPENLQAGYGTERDIAIVFIDIRSFTPLSERLGAQRSVELLSVFHASVVPVIRSHGGAVDKFLGDGILVSFGAIEMSSTAAADALRLMEDLPAAVEACNEQLKQRGFEDAIRIGSAMSSGQTLVGIVGDGARLEHTIIGRPVNSAAKLEEVNKALGSEALTFASCLETAMQQGFKPKERPTIIPGYDVPGMKSRQNIAIIRRQTPLLTQQLPLNTPLLAPEPLKT